MTNNQEDRYRMEVLRELRAIDRSLASIAKSLKKINSREEYVFKNSVTGKACSTCKYLMGSWCQKHDQNVEPEEICDSWEGGEGCVETDIEK